MLFKDIVDGKFKAFSRMKDEERARNIGVVKYIETLASMAGINIRDWDAKDIFGKDGKESKTAKLIDNKNEINRRFFEEVDKLAAAAPVSANDIFTEEVRQSIKNAESRHITNLMAKEQQAADSRLREAMAFYRSYEAEMKKCGEHSASVRRLSNQTSNIEDQVGQIQAGNFWTFTGLVEGTKLKFATRADVVLTHKNPAAGVDININFGRFEAVFSLVDFTLRCNGIERNINVSGYPHPHIQGNGGICWGSASTTATRALSTCSFVEPLTLLAAVISSYNSGSPYITMERFQEHIGLPAENLARDAMNRSRDASRALFTPIDALTADLDRHRAAAADAPTVVGVTTGPAPMAPVQNMVEELEPAPMALPASRYTYRITTTTENTTFNTPASQGTT